MNKQFKKGIFYLFTSMILLSCGNKKDEKMQKHTLDGRTQGTYYHIVYYNFEDKIANSKGTITSEKVKKGIDSILNAIDASLSLWNPQSTLSKVNKNETTSLDNIFLENFKASKHFWKLTDGYFDITVAPLIKAYGFANEKRQKLTPEQQVAIMQYIGFEKVNLIDNKIKKDFEEIQLDFNAIAQGYTTDKISEYLRKHNINSHIVDVGGEVYAAEKKPDGQKWRVAIEEPSDSIDAPREYNSFIKLENQAIVTSGSYRKFIIEDGVKYSHTINPKTGEAIKHNLLSVSVTAKNATAADAIATAFMAMGMDKAKEFIVKNPEYGAFFIFCDDKGKTKTCATKQIESLIEIVE